MLYLRDDRYLSVSLPIDELHAVLLRSSQIRQERTGIHARLEIMLNGATLAWSQLNIDKDEERVRLSNSAYKHIRPTAISTKYPVEDLKAHLDDYCAGLWDKTLEEHTPTRMPGNLVHVPTEFLIEPFIINGGGSILFGPPGRGKSWVIMLMAVALDAGLSYPFHIPKPRRVLFINIERAAHLVQNRLGAINRALGLPADRPLLTLNAKGKSLADIYASAQKAVREENVDVVLLDSISRAGFGDLNENAAVNRIIDSMNNIASSWLGLAHTPRQDESHVFGSVHFEAGADVVIQLLSQQEGTGPLGIGLKVVKKNDFGPATLRIIALDFTDKGLSTIRYADPHEFMAIEEAKKGNTKHDLRQLLLDEGPMSATEAAAKLNANRTYISNMLANDPIFVNAGRRGSAVLYGVKEGH